MDTNPTPPAAAPAEPSPKAKQDDALLLLAVDTLKGDVRDFILDRLKHDHSALPWNLRGEDDQRLTIERADQAAEHLVRRMFSLCMSLERPTIVAKLVQGKRKGEKIAFEAQIDAKDALRHAAMDCVGSEVLLVLAQSDLVLGDRGMPKPKPDQGGLFPDGGDWPGGDGDDGGPVFDNTGFGGNP